MEKKAILQTLIEQYGDGSQRKFAKLLGVTPQVINNWLTRGTLDYQLIYEKCQDLSGDWLLSGTGPMTKQDANIYRHPATPDELEDLRDQLRQSRESCGELYDENKRLRAQLSLAHAKTINGQ